MIRLFDFLFKKDKQEQTISKRPYWSLTTEEGEVITPSWKQITEAIDKATPDGSAFASLGYMHTDQEIEIVQTISDDGQRYSVEALPGASYRDGEIYVNDYVSKQEAIGVFEQFYNNLQVDDFRSWKKKKI